MKDFNSEVKVRRSEEGKFVNGEHHKRNEWLMGVAGWLIPGAGHLLQGRWQRGLMQGAAVVLMFLTGLWLGGHLFPTAAQDGQNANSLLQLPALVANGGTGVLYGLCWLTNTGFRENAQLSTFEYGNTFLLVAGLLNYIVMLDAFDIAVERKS